MALDEHFTVDPAKIDARIAEHETEATLLDGIAQALEDAADEKRREAHRLRQQNAALLETAKRYGYPEPDGLGESHVFENEHGAFGACSCRVGVDHDVEGTPLMRNSPISSTEEAR